MKMLKARDDEAAMQDAAANVIDGAATGAVNSA
jgi:hypothetical protein